MKTLKKLFALGAAAGSVILSGGALAQQAPVASIGEVQNNIVACFYECRNGTDPSWWQEVTTLMMAKAGSDEGPVRLWFLDGQSQFLARSELGVGIRDVDELNVCRTLQKASINPPATGMVLIVTNSTLSD